MAFTYLSIGSNLGNKELNLNTAIQLIALEVGDVLQVSSFYHSKAWGFSSENDFLNAALLLSTDLTPMDLLEKTQMIERKMGRSDKSTKGYKDRIIDIDILFYDNLIINQPKLKIPHPLMQMRDFVLIPMAEIAPEFIHPSINETMLTLKSRLSLQKDET